MAAEMLSGYEEEEEEEGWSAMPSYRMPPHVNAPDRHHSLTISVSHLLQCTFGAEKRNSAVPSEAKVSS